MSSLCLWLLVVACGDVEWWEKGGAGCPQDTTFAESKPVTTGASAWCEKRNGRKDGPWIEWDRQGNKKKEGTYENGKRNGVITFWDENGNKTKEAHWREGVLMSEKTFAEPDKSSL